MLAYVSPRPDSGEIHVFPVHANVLFLTEARPIPDTPRTLASTSPSGSVSPKIIQKISQGATPEHRTLQSPNFARCNTTTSHPATLSCCTLQHRAIAPCHFRLSHPATQNDSFGPLKPPCASSSRFHSIHNPPPPIEWQGTFTLSMSIIREESFLSHNHSLSRRRKQVHYLLFTWRGYICAAVSRQAWTSSG